MPYYYLLIKWPELKEWSIEFGDYDKDTVVSERLSYLESYEISKRQTMILKCEDDSTEAFAKALNNK
jgi:hypothetical protein